ncbi:kinesin-like protein [Hypoxylon texense]
MTPTTRLRAKEAEKVAAICLKDISPETIKSFFGSVHDQVALVARRDLSKLVTENAHDASLQPGSIETFDEPPPKSDQIILAFMDVISRKDGISKVAFICLDAVTAKDGATCFIATDSRGDKFADGLGYLGFRCVFASVPSALDALDSGMSVRELRNESVMAGGIWAKEVMDAQRARASHIDLTQFPPHEAWDDVDMGPPSHFSVFRTAHISTATLNEFLEQAYSQRFGEDVDPRVAFITGLTTPYTEGLASPPLASTPKLPEQLLGAKPADCDAIVRSCFPDTTLNPKLNHNRFIIMDEHTEKEKTVIMALNSENDGQLLLVRSKFEGAVLCLYAPGNTGLFMEEMADEGAKMEKGLYPV